MEINRRQFEKTTASIAITLLGLMTLALVLVVSNYIFGWDLFPKSIEKIGLVILLSVFFTILSSVIINIMLNIGIIADKISFKK